MPQWSAGALPPTVVVGGYTADSGGRARGVSLLRRRQPPSALPELVEADVLELASPTYLVGHPSRPWLFAASEAEPSQVSSIGLQDDGSLVLLSTVATGGDGACHLALAPDGSELLVAHYGSGSVASFTVGADGRLSPLRDLVSFAGSGPVPDRQQAPHAHQVVWDGAEVLVPDLGSDRLHRLRVAEDGRLGEAGPPVELPSGSGPRHLVVLGQHLVVACELSGQLWLGRRRRGGGWAECAATPCSSAAAAAAAQPSALRAEGQRLYVANRGPGTVAVFALDARAGTLRRTDEFGSGGASPRDLVLGSSQLWVANQADDVLSVFDRQSLPAGAAPLQVPSPTPACVLLDPFRGR